MAKGKIKKKMQKRFNKSGRLMLSQKVTKRPGWNHEIAIGWRSKKVHILWDFNFLELYHYLPYF